MSYPDRFYSLHGVTIIRISIVKLEVVVVEEDERGTDRQGETNAASGTKGKLILLTKIEGQGGN